MADASADTLASISAVQAALYVINALLLTAFRYPSDCPLTNGTYYDYIIVGGGSAGSALAYRLSANTNNKVLLIEEGSYPPFVSELAGLFTPMPKSAVDYNTLSVDDKYTAQNMQNSCISLTQGKMLGGGSNINHDIYVQGDPHDFNNWAEILSDKRWSYNEVLPYFKKLERLTDPGLLASDYVNVHGTDGMIKIARQIDSVNDNYLNAFGEMGHKVVDDTSSSVSSLGATTPLYAIGDNIRQSNSYAYLRLARFFPNLCLALSTKATKILFDKNTAVGVQVTTSTDESLSLYANKEVIVSAGAIHSPQLLMLSGIGPKKHLESMGIPLVADLPVGENLMDHPSAVLLIQMEKTNATVPAANFYQFPVPVTTLYAALDSSQTYPDYQTINLLFPHDSPAMMQLCTNVFKYSNEICNIFYEANIGRNVLFVVHNLMQPKSRGNILLASNDPTVDPIVNLGQYTNEDDLNLMTDCLADFTKVLESTYFKSVGAQLVDIKQCTGKTDKDYWKCIGLAMSSTMWHYAGTCSMGLVVDTEMRVLNVNNLRVVDASVMPTEVSGNINAAVTMVAERAADFILSAA